jgi:tetratricopeptide (TPR) repeat protein
LFMGVLVGWGHGWLPLFYSILLGAGVGGWIFVNGSIMLRERAGTRGGWHGQAYNSAHTGELIMVQQEDRSGMGACGRCGSSVGAAMRFCPACGGRLAGDAQRLPRQLVVTAGVTVLLCGSAVGIKNGLQWKRGDIRPAAAVADQSIQKHTAISPDPADQDNDPELVALRSDLDRAPEDPNALRALAAALGDRLRARPGVASALVFEAIDVVSRILVHEPEATDALLMMGDISFDQQAFSKAAQFYERYLALVPSDRAVISRYASTLTFLGRYDESIEKLRTVLRDDPANFPAAAYLAITVAQKGDVAEARTLGARALELAPTEEARARFNGFLTSLEKGGSAEKVGAVPNQAIPAAAPAVAAQGVEAFVAAVRANPVAGPKFVRFERPESQLLQLYFADFPMAQMPPFAKQKFFSGLSAALKAAGLPEVREVRFVDAKTGAALDTLTVGAE